MQKWLLECAHFSKFHFRALGGVTRKWGGVRYHPLVDEKPKWVNLHLHFLKETPSEDILCVFGGVRGKKKQFSKTSRTHGELKDTPAGVNAKLGTSHHQTKLGGGAAQGLGPEKPKTGFFWGLSCLGQFGGKKMKLKK